MPDPSIYIDAALATDAQQLREALTQFERYERSTMRHTSVVEVRDLCARVVREITSRLESVQVEDADGAPYTLHACECDNTHEQNNTVCRWCWAHGRRLPTDPEVSRG
jgi:hypothetical protein